MKASRMGDMREFFQRDAVAKYLGAEIVSLESGYATVKMEVRGRHLNLFGTVHGGVLFALADIAFGLAGNANGTPAVAIDATISYMKSARNGTLYAEACEYSSQGPLASYRVVVTEEGGEPIALFQGMAYRKSIRAVPPIE
jgi:acyl-CoA thioesterase